MSRCDRHSSALGFRGRMDFEDYDLSVTRPHVRACAARYAGWMSLSRVIASLLFVGITMLGCTNRTLILHHVHTGEKLTTTYKVGGQYDAAALNKINWIMRDWRTNKATTMDTQLIDLLWEVYRGVGATQPIEIVGGYRTPSTNEMLRTSGPQSGVALHSLHMSGKAIDFYIPGISLERLRETAIRLQGGGVGYYPMSGSPFVHVDVGNVSAWARLTRAQLVKVFPDGQTKHLPADDTPLAADALARADIEHDLDYRAIKESAKRSSQALMPGRSKNGEGVALTEGVAVASSANPRPPPAPAVVVAIGYRGYGRSRCETRYIPYGWTWHRASSC
jgi:uncharacterized protein YcbK (DUF882 family)